MRHFKVDTTASALQLSFIEALIKREGVKYTFEPDKNGMENMGFKLGDYDIYVDEDGWTCSSYAMQMCLCLKIMRSLK